MLADARPPSVYYVDVEPENSIIIICFLLFSSLGKGKAIPLHTWTGP
jgi:hypothetical protein